MVQFEMKHFHVYDLNFIACGNENFQCFLPKTLMNIHAHLMPKRAKEALVSLAGLIKIIPLNNVVLHAHKPLNGSLIS